MQGVEGLAYLERYLNNYKPEHREMVLSAVLRGNIIKEQFDSPFGKVVLSLVGDEMQEAMDNIVGKLTQQKIDDVIGEVKQEAHRFQASHRLLQRISDALNVGEAHNEQMKPKQQRGK